MIMPPALRKFALTAHVAASVGWLGAVATFLVIAVAGLTGPDAPRVRAAYLAMELIGRYVLVPLCLAALVTGLVVSLGTAWGVLRHYWVLFKLLITMVASLILFQYTQTLGYLGMLTADPAVPLANLRDPSPVFHAAAALLALLGTLVLSIYKPRGLTPYGQRRRHKPPHQAQAAR
jgi:hypothetical protein